MRMLSSLGACKGMAGVTGLEPATSGVTGRHSNQLSYTPRGAAAGGLPCCVMTREIRA